MNKEMIVIGLIFAALLFAGCASQPQETVTTEDTVAQEQTVPQATVTTQAGGEQAEISPEDIPLAEGGDIEIGEMI